MVEDAHRGHLNDRTSHRQDQGRKCCDTGQTAKTPDDPTSRQCGHDLIQQRQPGQKLDRAQNRCGAVAEEKRGEQVRERIGRRSCRA
jgi:hypothetical protein